MTSAAHTHLSTHLNTQLAGRRVVVLGLGITGLSVTRWCVARGASVSVADTRSSPPQAHKLTSQWPQVPLETGPFSEATLAQAETLVVSPGLSKDQPLIAAARARGVEVIGDIELFARALPPKLRVIAITGSNGKTTVTSLVAELLAASGVAVKVAGNIGEPALDVLMECEERGSWPDVFVLELSSFQLETTNSLRPVVAAVLNVTENHLDRYADMAEYAAAKARILTGLADDGTQVLNRNDPYCMAMARSDRALRTFGRDAPADIESWGLAAAEGTTWLMQDGRALMKTADLMLVGEHNAVNAAAALAVSDAVTPSTTRTFAALRSFQGLPHRMQRIAEAGGVIYVNDSKGTTVAATLAALKGLSRKIVLIAGGDGKGQDFSPLREPIEQTCRAVILIGRDGPRIAAILVDSQLPLEHAPSLEAAVERAAAYAKPGDAVLLSPACASLDMFRDYVERGERFIKAVQSSVAQEHSHAQSSC